MCVGVCSTHGAVGGVRAPQVGAGTGAVVGVVSLGLMDPLPVQVLAEVDVEPAHTAVLLHVAVGEAQGPGRQSTTV